MSANNQTIFTRAYTEKLKEDLRSGSSIDNYLGSKDMILPSDATLQSTLTVSGKPPVLDPSIGGDADNAIKLYEYLYNLDKTQASDKRLWVYLSHVTFKEYTQKRWSIGIEKSDIEQNPDARKKAVDMIEDRWFVAGSARSMRRHSIARLWWAACLTDSPWVKDPEFFGELQSADRYIYTRILFSNQDVLQQILERKLGWSDRMLIAILEYLRRNPSLADREHFRELIKEINLVLGYRKINTLSLQDLLEVMKTAEGTSI